MASVQSSLRFFLLVLALFASVPVFCQDSNALPNAPVPDHASDTSHMVPSKWFGVVDPGERVPPLDTRDKMMFWLHGEISPVSLLPALISAGYGQATGFDPKYGNDAGAFGEKLGAAALRQASMRFFSSSLLPTLTHSDPRFFRMGYGSAGERSRHALKQLFIQQRDSGESGFNYSDIFGRLAGSALAMTYYPGPSVRTTVVFRTWGTSLAGAEVDNLLLEFWPDIRDAVFHRNRKSARAQLAGADSR